jgi:SAM-dependent methyltransferase
MRQIRVEDKPDEFGEGLITLDINPDLKPDVVWDLENLPLPFDENMFNEIHAYQVLEHLGGPGDYKQFFGLFDEIYRISRPKCKVCISVPRADNVWAWGDPSHKRIMPPQQFQFLDQNFYKEECDGVRKSQCSDFRYMYKSDFHIIWYKQDVMSELLVLEAIK